ENRGNFPRNSADITQFWYQKQFLGRSFASPVQMADDTVAGGVMLCPDDMDDAIRSYAMNIFASSQLSHFAAPSLAADPPAGRLFKAGVNESASMILLTEGWPELPQPEG